MNPKVLQGPTCGTGIGGGKRDVNDRQSDEYQAVQKESKGERLNAHIVDGLRDFLGMFWRTHGQGDKVGGRISLEDQNVYDMVMTALNSGNLTTFKFGILISRTLNMSHW